MTRIQSIKPFPCLRLTRRLSALILALLLPGTASASAAASISAPHTEVALLSEMRSIAPGTSFDVAVRLTPDPGWHTYWRNPGDTGLPTRIDWTLPAGGEAGAIRWPPPERIDYQGLINYGYHGPTLLLTRITPPPDLAPGDSYAIQAQVRWLVCKDICIPASGQIAMSLPVTAAADPGPDADAFTAARRRLPETVADAQARFHLDEDLVMRWSGAAGLFDGGRGLQFFPVTTDLVRNAAEPQIRMQGGDVLIRTERNPDFQGPVPRQLDALLVAGTGSEARAYRFTGTASPTPIAFPETAAREHRPAMGLAGILLLALAGGFILNLMPCVFPVLSIKILSLIKSGSHDPRQRRRHGLAYTGGVVLSMLLFAGILLGLRAAGEAVGWGFQLQSPWFVAVLAYVLFVMGLSLSGLIEMGAALSRAGGLLQRHHGLTGSFLNGALATIVATPCTVPFMATAVGFALTQSVAVALSVFAVLGLGLASPFLLVAFVPALAERLPKPGHWMETLKQLLAFPLYFTVIWLLWILDRQAGSDVLALVMAGLVLLALALWLWRLAGHSRRPLWPRGLALLALLAALALLPGWLVQGQRATRPPAAAGDDYPAVAYSAEALRAARAEQRPVFVNINADWCITCKVNERIALDDARVQEAFRQRNVLYMVGDWTDGDATLSRLLARFGRSGVPLYLFYRPGEPEPQILPQLLTPATVIAALED